MTILEEGGKILGIPVFPGRWKATIDRLDVSGAFTRKRQMELLIMLCERMEKLEEKNPVTEYHMERSDDRPTTTAKSHTKTHL